MIIPDINLLLYAYDSNSVFHDGARIWWQRCLSQTEIVGMPEVVAFGFVRLATNRRVFEHPMTPAESIGQVRSWLAQPNVQTLEPGPRHLEHVLQLIDQLGAAGNLVSDAQIAAIAIQQQAILHTADTDFMRFPGLRWFNPLTKVGSGLLRRTRGK